MTTKRRAGGTDRILNCLPSRDQDDDWDVGSAAGGRRAHRPAPASRVDRPARAAGGRSATRAARARASAGRRPTPCCVGTS